MNRGVEIAAEVADRPDAVITEQVRNGVPVRMAVLFLLLGSGSELFATATPLRGAHDRRPDRPRRTSPVLDLVIKGGTIVDVDGRAGRPTSASRAAASGPSRPASTFRPGAEVLDAGGCVVAPGPGRPAHPPAPARAGGGRDHRVGQPGRGARAATASWWPCPTPTRPWTASRSSTGCARRPRERALCAVEPSAAITVGRAGEALAPMAELAAAGRAHLHRRRQRRAGRPAHAAGHGVRQRPRGDPGPALRDRPPGRRRPHARGRVVVAPGHPRHPGRGRGAHGQPRPGPGPPDRGPDALPAPVHRRLGRAGPGGQGRRDWR